MSQEEQQTTQEAPKMTESKMSNTVAVVSLVIGALVGLVVVIYGIFDKWDVIGVIACGLISGLGTALFCMCVGAGAQLSEEWKVAADGTYDSVQYVNNGRAGMRTVVRFQDGSSCVMNGSFDITFPRGTRIRIHKNGFDTCRLEEVK